jgi:hypothetical protein
MGATGPTGATGATGPSGAATATVATTTGALDTALSVQCAAGKVATGGGAYAAGGGLNTIEVSAPLNSSGSRATAGQTPTGWTATMASTNSGITVTVYVVCAL